MRKIDYFKGKVLNSINLNESFFGEGLTLFDDKIIQLTWRSKKGFIYNKNDMKIEKSFPYQESKEGWDFAMITNTYINQMEPILYGF